MDETIKLIPVVILAGIAVYLLYKLAEAHSLMKADEKTIEELRTENSQLENLRQGILTEARVITNHVKYQNKTISNLRKALDEALDSEEEAKDSEEHY